MRWVLAEVPWGNLWRTVASTCLFFALLWLPFAIATPLDSGATTPAVEFAVLFVAGILAAIVVWSDTVPWIGDD